MNILLDHQIFSMQKFGGISTYFNNLYKHLSVRDDMKPDISIRYSDNDDILAEDSLGASRLISRNFRGKFRIQNYLNKKRSVEFLKRDHFDVFHPTYYDPYFLRYLNGRPFVLTIFDMAFEKHYTAKIHKKLISNKKKLAERSARIISISEKTKNDIIEVLGIDSSRIEVIYLAGDHILSDEKPESQIFDRRYILYVGSRKGYKNFPLLIEAISPILKGKELFLVCAGGGNFTGEEQRLLRESGIRDKVIFADAGSSFLFCLYKNAEFLVFPSTFEGFGIPVLEAFVSGCPVVMSDIDVFREIGRDAALYFDPLDKGSIHNKVIELLDNSAAIEDLKKKGLERSKFFSWEKTAARTCDIYKDAAGLPVMTI